MGSLVSEYKKTKIKYLDIKEEVNELREETKEGTKANKTIIKRYQT